MFGFPPVFTLFPIQLQEKLCPCLCFDQVERGMCNRFERNVELFAMRISSPVSLRQEQALHLLAVMPQSCFLKPGILPAPQAVALLPVASSQKACGESLCSCVMQKKRKERRQSRLKIDHQCRATVQDLGEDHLQLLLHCKGQHEGFITQSAVGLKPFSKQPLFSLFFQPWPFEPSLNSSSPVHILPGFFLPLLFSLLVCLESLGLCCRHQMTLNFSHVTLTQETGKIWV